MPTREKLTAALVKKAKQQLKMYVADLREHPIDATLAMFIICLYEVAIITYSYEAGKQTANYTDVKAAVNTTYKVAFDTLRNNLTHNFTLYTTVNDEIFTRFIAFGEEAFNQVTDKCCNEPDMFAEIMQYCGQVPTINTTNVFDIE